MEGILDWGTEVVLWFQQFSPTLDPLFRSLTFMGEEDFFLLLLPFVYWCLDRRNGARLTILFLLSTYLNAVIKVVAGQPRPFQYDPRVQKLWETSGNGFPSNHTQGAVVVWGYLAAQFRRRWLSMLAAVLMVLIPLSRIYLGMHFPTDLLGGYLLGAGVLLLYLWWEPRAEEQLDRWGVAGQLGLAVAVPILLTLCCPIGDEASVTAVATMMGLGVGFALERHWVGFLAAGPWWKRAVRLLLGVAGLFVLRFGLSTAFAGLRPAPVFRFIRYGLVGLWGGLGAPWAFVRVGLAAAESDR
ncbi:MAG: phosphatase PAP2 family protein [Anaerolineae bacterium]